MRRQNYSGSERRRFPRTHIVTNVKIHHGGQLVHGTLINISIGGLLLEAEIRISPTDGQDQNLLEAGIPVIIDIPKLRVVALKGRILRVISSGMGHSMAVSFDEIRRDVADRIIERFARK